MIAKGQHMMLCAFLLALTATLTTGQNNTSDEYDYFLLVRQWGATFCGEGHCAVRPVNRFSIHGLWPERIDGSWPSCCDSDYPFRIQKIIDLIPELAHDWFSYTAGIKYQCNWDNRTDDVAAAEDAGMSRPTWAQRIIQGAHHLLSRTITRATGRSLLGKGRHGGGDGDGEKGHDDHEGGHKHRDGGSHHHHHDDDEEHQHAAHMHDEEHSNATHHHHHDDKHHEGHHEKHHEGHHEKHDNDDDDEDDHDDHHHHHEEEEKDNEGANGHHHHDHHHHHEVDGGSPNYQFWQHEWEKHGTCSLDVFRNEKDYFKTVLKLNHKFKIDDYLSDADIVPADDQYRFKDVFGAITKGAGAEPFISCKEGKINEVWLCFDKDMTIFDCPPNKTPEFLKCGKYVTLPSAKTGKHHHHHGSSE